MDKPVIVGGEPMKDGVGDEYVEIEEENTLDTTSLLARLTGGAHMYVTLPVKGAVMAVTPES